AYYLAGTYKFGNDAVKLAYGKANQVGITANTGANQVSLGYDHGMSKRTKLYAIYTRISNNAGAMYGFSQSTATAAGAAGTNATVNGLGASPSAISLGIKHSF
ncbi:MAG TPA: porin, partial [Gallionella sp.]|nr:porin [Gallionella sp.]